MVFFVGLSPHLLKRSNVHPMKGRTPLLPAALFMVAGAGLVPPTPCWVKSAMAGLVFSSPRLGQSLTIPSAVVAGAGAHICAETCGSIPWRRMRIA